MHGQLPAPVRAPPPSVVAVQPAGARLPSSAPLPPAEVEAFVDGMVRSAMARDHLVGVSVSVVQDGRAVLEKGYGLAALSPARPVDPARTLFRLGSVSKVLTWIEVLKQVERGRLNPDAPIDDALPADLKLGLEGFREPVRLRHLMTHTAGFEAREFGRLFKDRPERLQGLDVALRTARSHRVREAGLLASYSNYGAALAGAAAAAAAKTPFDRLMEDDLLKPAGMADTSFREPYAADPDLPEPLSAALADRMATGYRWSGRSLVAAPVAYGQDFAPAVSASSTAHDMARLMALVLDGAAPVGGGAARALLTPLQRPPLGLPGWSYGLRQEQLPGGFEGFGHDGATPAFHAALLMVPALRLGVFVAANTDSGGTLARSLGPGLVARFYAGPDPAEAAPPPAVDAARYAGRYLTTRRAYHGLEGLIDRLQRTLHVRVGPDGRLTVSETGGRVRQFVPAGQDRFREAGGSALIGFTGPDPGQPARLLLDPERGEAATRSGWLHDVRLLAGLAGLVAFSAGLSLLGLLTRDWRDYRQTRTQAAANRVQTLAALLWLGALGGFAVFLRGARDPARMMYDWPNVWLVAGSWAAVAATLLTVVQLVLLRQVWADTRRLHGWTDARKLAHSFTAVLHLAFALVLAAWGALEPWSS
jgi:CubicO group peptidase (beta-lactamase class C family)